MLDRRADQTAGAMTLRARDGRRMAGGVFSRDGRSYILDQVSMEDDADWPELVELTLRLVSAEPFPGEWQMRVIARPEPR